MIAADVVAKSGEAVKSGPIGLAVILVLCVACYFLFKSMSKHLKTVREDFPSDAPAAADSTDGRVESSATDPRATDPRATDARATTDPATDPRATDSPSATTAPAPPVAPPARPGHE
jgi:hypothetical protein